MNYLSQLFVHSGMEMASLLSFLAVTVCVGAIVTFFVKWVYFMKADRDLWLFFAILFPRLIYS